MISICKNILTGYDKIAALLIEKKNNVNFEDEHAQTALHLAAENGSFSFR